MCGALRCQDDVDQDHRALAVETTKERWCEAEVSARGRLELDLEPAGLARIERLIGPDDLLHRLSFAQDADGKQSF